MKTGITNGWDVREIDIRFRRKNARGLSITAPLGQELEEMTKLVLPRQSGKYKVESGEVCRETLLASLFAVLEASSIRFPDQLAVLGGVQDGAVTPYQGNVRAAVRFSRQGYNVIVPDSIGQVCAEAGLNTIPAYDVLDAVLNHADIPNIGSAPDYEESDIDRLNISVPILKKLSGVLETRGKALVIFGGLPAGVWLMTGNQLLPPPGTKQLQELAAIHDFYGERPRRRSVHVQHSISEDGLFGCGTYPGALSKGHLGVVVVPIEVYLQYHKEIDTVHRTGVTRCSWPARFAMFVTTTSESHMERLGYRKLGATKKPTKDLARIVADYGVRSTPKNFDAARKRIRRSSAWDDVDKKQKTS